MRFIRFVLLTVVFCATAQMQAVGAQSAVVTGKLIDPNKSTIVGLEAGSITLTNQKTNELYSSPISSKTGEFSVKGLPAGTYDVRVPLGCCMYRSYEQKGLVIKAGEAKRLELPIEWHMNLGTIGDDPTTFSADLRRRAGNVTGPTPRTPDGKPDFTGVWSFGVRPTGAPPSASSTPRRAPSMKPWAAEIQRKLDELGVDKNPAAYCLPSNATPSMYPSPQKLIQTPSVIVQLTEWFDPGYRQIFLDGRKHPEDWNPSWMGHSVGHWEGDTLVVETVGFNEITPMGAIHSDQLRIVERFTRPDLGHLFIDITAEDPEAWTEPFHTSAAAALLPDEEVLEWVCEENNREAIQKTVPWRGRP